MYESQPEAPCKKSQLTPHISGATSHGQISIMQESRGNNSHSLVGPVQREQLLML